MRIYQITDLHVPEHDAGPEFDHVKPNVQRQISFIESTRPDLLVISGDLSMKDGSKEACEWLRSALPAGMRTIVMPGNHDDPEVLWEVFGPGSCVNERFYFVIEEKGWKLIFVNTTTDVLPRDQINFLRKEGRNSAAILFIHHPPDLISEGYMALNQPLLNYSEVSDAIRATGITHVFCGHYHNAIDKDCDGFRVYVTPSPAFQIELHSREFKMEPFEPAVRHIELEQNSVNTRLVYV